MASLFNSKHNKYVSIPDWFKDVKPVEEQKIETKTTYIGGGGVSSISGLSNITIYNKFVLKDAELDNEALIIKDIALNGIETEEHKIGDEIPAIGWNTTEYTSIAGSSTMTVTSTIIENQYGFGVFFYDNALSHISNVVLQNAIEEVIVPANAYYFRISVPANDESFNVRYNKSEAYNSEQLALSDKNVTDYLTLNDLIPEGKNETVVSGNSLKLLVQSPLSLTKDINNVVKLSIGNIIKESSNDMFVWDKKLAAFGYDSKTGTAYSYVEGEQQFTTDSQGNQVPVTTDNPEFWMYDDALSDKWIIKSTRPRISWLDNLIEYDEEKNYFKLHGNLLVTGGVTMYATDEDDTGGGEGDEDDPELPENIEQVIEELKKIFVTTTEEVQNIEGVKNFLNGLSIGTRRMYEWKDDVIYLDSNLVVRGGITMYGNTGDVEPNEWYTSLPIADPLYWDYSSGSPVLSLGDAVGSIDSINVTGDGNAITGAVLTDNGKSISFTKSIKFATFDELQNFVTLKGDPQTIESQKNFTGGLLVNGNEIVYDKSTNCWKLDGNLLISGGITMYNINPASIPSFMQSLLLDDKTLKLNAAGELTVKAGAGGTDGINEDQLQSLLDEWGYVTDKDSLKNPYSLSWSGYSSGSYDGSSAKSITIPNNTDQLENGAGYITKDALTPYALENWVSDTFDDIDDQFTEVNKTLNTKWTQNDTKISNWDTAFGWGDHAKAGYALQTYVDDTFVTLKTEQEIEGKKDFTTGGLFVNGNQIIYDKSKRYWKLDGNLLVTGGITMYGSESGFSSSSIMDAILTDGKSIRVNPSTKQLEVIGGAGGGVNENAVRDLIESYNYVTLADIPTASTSTKGIASFNSSHFTVSSGEVSLKTPVVTSSGTPSSYNANTLYIIL